METTVLSLIAAIEALPVPALALVHGQCYAGALEVCLSCDLIWAAEGNQIEAVAVSIPYAGGSQRIASRIGAGRAAEMVGAQIWARRCRTTPSASSIATEWQCATAAISPLCTEQTAS
jgi:enoyl-CoA hydratase/carnithine racemase